MATSTIPLAKKVNFDKLHFPVYVSEKIDGVPIKFTIGKEVEKLTTRSGRGSTISCGFIKDQINGLLTRVSNSEVDLIGEVTHLYDKSFKDVSGHVRRMKSNPDLIINFFECNMTGCEKSGFGARQVLLKNILGPEVDNNPLVNIIPQVKCYTLKEVEILTKSIPDGQEGWIIRNGNDHYKAGKRSWGYQKIVKTPTKDLKVVRFDEAISKDGEPLDMVGKLWIRYKGKTIGCGPGKLTHKERKELWAWAKPFGGDIRTSEWIAEIKYKVDPSYDALREASFVCWRHDKDEPNED